MGAEDVPRAVDFWTRALGYVPREDPEDDWAVLVPVSGPGPRISLGLSRTPIQPHPRVHLDLYAGDAADQAAEVERLIALGAQRNDIGQGDVPWEVMVDPEGNDFCVLSPRD